ncbi:hypothetical protein B0H19DRAFT_1337789 [Mycena capillaripes]|nr:hypothetical protein B0H19DRAFT_1337789 [Mycena capillaripes]
MVPPRFLSAIFLVSFCAWGCARAALVNRTIEDFDPSMQYNCTVQRCDANSTNSNPCNMTDQSDFVNRSFTWTSKPCQITIPFVGTAVYAFMNCGLCQFEVDKTGLHPETHLGDGPVFQLAYFNNTLANDTHTLVITSTEQIQMDSVVYTFDDSLTPTTQDAASTTSTSASAISTSGPAKGGQTEKPPKPRAHVGAIVGGVLGGLALTIVLATAVIFFKRRTGRRNKMGRMFLGNPDPATHPSPQSDVEADPSARVQHNSVLRLEAQIRELQAQTAELRTALGTQPQRAPSEGTRLAAMKREQIQAVRDHAPAVLPKDLLLHTDSGIRLTPARQVEELPPQYIDE